MPVGSFLPTLPWPPPASAQVAVSNWNGLLMYSFNKRASGSVAALCCVLMLTVNHASAQAAGAAPSIPGHSRYTVQRFGDQFGMGAVTVTTLAQEKQGFLWIGTQTGLARYDGVRIQRWPEVDKIAGHYIDQLLIAPNETVWVKGSVGLGYFSNRRFEQFPLPAGLKPTGISQSLAIDKEGHLFLAVDQGLLRAEVRDPSHFRLFTVKDGLPGRVDGLVTGPDDSVWFTSEHKLGHFASRGENFEIDPEIILPSEPIYGLIFDGSGTLWVRSASHVLRFDRGSHRFIPDDRGVPPVNTDASQPTLDRGGNLLVPTSAGLYWRDHGSWRAITDKEGLTSNAVQAALEDREGVFWIGASGSGIDRLMGFRQWNSWTTAEGLPDNVVWQTVRDRRGRLWVSTSGGIAIWEGSNWRTLTKAQGLCGSEVRSIVNAGDGAVWALSPVGGLMRVDPETFRVQCFPTFNGRRYIALAVTPNGEVWAASGRGFVVRFEGAGSSVHPVEVVMPEAVRGDVWYLGFAPDGALWSSGPDRIVTFDGKTWRLITSKDGMMGSAVTSMAPISSREAWLGYVDVGAVSHLRLTEQGAPQFEHHPWDVVILGVDRDRRIWFDGTNGITVLSPDGNIESLNHSKGLLWDDVSPMGVRQEADGSYLIATTRGLARYAPSAQAPTRIAPEVVFTSVLLSGKERLGGPPPEVKHKEGTLVAQFTPLVLQAPEHIACRYRLDGLEQDYTTLDQREIRFSGLTPGAYTLQVQCRDDSSGWPLKGAAFQFTVLSPWWQRWWAYLLAVVLVAQIVWLIVLSRTRSLNRRRIELEAAVAERSAELVEKNKALQEASLTDPLTQIRNRRYFYETVPSDAARVLRNLKTGMRSDTSSGELIIVMADIDNFKRVNDAYGHSVGDRLLREHARRLAGVIRKGDVLVRWGGEEFMLVCHATPRENVPMLCQRLMEGISATPYDLTPGVSLYKTCSFGWAPFPWTKDDISALSVENVIELADKALYLAKTGGKNQAVGILPAEGLRPGTEIRREQLLDLAPHLVQVIRTPNLTSLPEGGEPAEARARR